MYILQLIDILSEKFKVYVGIVLYSEKSCTCMYRHRVQKVMYVHVQCISMYMYNHIHVCLFLDIVFGFSGSLLLAVLTRL